MLQIYTGREEGSLLQRHLHCAAVAGARPTTYDLVVSLLGACRYRILRTCITALVGQTYYASIHLSPSAPPGTAPVLSSPAQPPLSPELDIDARPSDALNLAVRFDAPIYASRKVAARMATPARAALPALGHRDASVVQACREALVRFRDPLLLARLRQQMAIATEDYVEARRIQETLRECCLRHEGLRVAVALDAALEGRRFQEAEQLREKLCALQGAEEAPWEGADAVEATGGEEGAAA